MTTLRIFGADGMAKKWPLLDVGTDDHLWSMNGLHLLLGMDCVGPNAWFQIHRYEDLPNENPKHIEWLKQQHDFPIYMHQHYDEFPASVPLPREECENVWEAFFPDDPPIFASSFSWMVATALVFGGHDRIVVSGAPMWSMREAYLEAPNLMLWLGIAAGMGIKVDLDGRLMMPDEYGFEARWIPWWAPTPLAADIIMDYNRSTRDWRNMWHYASKNADLYPKARRPDEVLDSRGNRAQGRDYEDVT